MSDSISGTEKEVCRNNSGEKDEDTARAIASLDYKDQMNGRSDPTPCDTKRTDGEAAKDGIDLEGTMELPVARDAESVHETPFAEIVAAEVPQSQLINEEVQNLRRQVATGNAQSNRSKKFYFLVGGILTAVLVAISVAVGSRMRKRPLPCRTSADGPLDDCGTTGRYVSQPRELGEHGRTRGFVPTSFRQ